MTAGTNVVVAIGNDVVRYGIERMLQTHGLSVLPLGVPAGPGVAPVLIVLLAEYDEQTPARLRAAEEAGVKVLVLVDPGTVSELSRLYGTGGAGYLTLVDLDGRTLHDAVTRIAAGELPLSAGLARGLLTATPRARLTPREREALRLLVDGMSNRQIARRLDISEHGAKRLVANILSKMDCPNRTLAVAKALREGFGEPAPVI